MIAPPSGVINVARLAAMDSPCAKSKRGAVLMWVGDDEPGNLPSPVVPYATSSAFNGPPEPWTCDGTASCAKTCGMLCMHAEARCLRRAAQAGVRYLEPNTFTSQMRGNAGNYDLVHVKVVGDVVVPGGGPSCIQCSKAILDFGIRAVWLYEKQLSGDGLWRRYTAMEFHHETIANVAKKDGDPHLVNAMSRHR